MRTESARPGGRGTVVRQTACEGELPSGRRRSAASQPVDAQAAPTGAVGVNRTGSRLMPPTSGTPAASR